MDNSAPFHQLPGDEDRPASAFWTKAEDGVRLRLALWRSDSERTSGSVLLFPGRTEYIEKYGPVAQRLNAQGYDVLAIDWRGQGMSDRLQDDPRPGHVGDFADYQRDVVEMVVSATDLDLPRPWHLLAHSMGGCIGLAALMNDLPVETAVFSAPMWGINLRQMPHGVALGIAYLAGRLGRGGRAAPGSGASGSYMLDESFSANLLTSDVDRWCRLLRESAAWPQLTIGGASYTWVSRALNECSRLARMDSPAIPMTVSLGEEEKVVSKTAIRDRAAHWSGAKLLEIDGARHEVMMEVTEMREMFLEATIERFSGS